MVSAAFDDNATCTAAFSFKAPTPCPDDIDPCTSTTDCIGGNVFEDFNCNGTDDTEPGVQGVEIQIYDCNNALVGTEYSDSDGDWQVCGLTDGDAYRVEFVLPESIACWATPTHTSSGGNQSNVQFLTSPACTQFSVSSPDDYCQANPFLNTACYVNGTGDASYTGLVSIDYNSSGTEVTDPYTPLFTTADIGSVWGSAFQKNQSRQFLSTFLKRHVGMANGPGYVYYFDVNTTNGTSTAGLNSFILQGLTPGNDGTALGGTGTIDVGSVCRDASCGIATDYVLPASPFGQNIDLDAFGKVGQISFGDIDMSNENTLWLTNLNENQLSLLSLDVSGINPLGNINRYLVEQMSGFPTCTGGSPRIWALNFYRGRGYLGVVCDASVSQDINDLQQYVLSFDPQKYGQWFYGGISWCGSLPKFWSSMGLKLESYQ